MASENTVTLVGNVTRDPDLRYTASGRGVVSLGLAVNRRWQSNGEWQEEVSFFNVTAWGDLAENIAASFEKGTRAIVTGRLQQRQYTTQDGDERSVVELVADAAGPDLRWAQVQIERIARDRAPKQQQPDPVYGDEEPF